MGALNGRGKRTHAAYLVDVDFSFRIDGTNNPDAIRQSKADIIKSVVRDSTGLFTVTFKQGLPGLPVQLTNAFVQVHDPSSTLTSASLPAGGGVINQAIVVASSGYTVQVYTLTANGAGAQAIADPTDNSWVAVHLCGPQINERKDAN